MKNNINNTNPAITNKEIRTVFEKISAKSNVQDNVVRKPEKVDIWTETKVAQIKRELEKTGYSSLVTVMPLDKLTISTVQREVKLPRVSKIIANFDPFLVEYIVVNYDSSTKKWEVFDGQHTLIALTALGEVECQAKVYIDLTKEQQLKIFLNQNKKRSKITSWDEHIVSVNNNDKKALLRQAVCDEYGVTICERNGYKDITSIRWFDKLDKKLGEDAMDCVRYTLQLIKDSGWDSLENGYVEKYLNVGYYSYKVCRHSVAKYKKLLNIIKGYESAEEFVEELKKKSDSNSQGHPEEAARALVTLLCS